MMDTKNDALDLQSHIFSFMDIHPEPAVLDIGCGNGNDLLCLGQLLDEKAKLVGIDSSVKAISAANQSIGDDSRYEFIRADVSEGLPFGNVEFDIVYSINLLECIVDKVSFLKEVHRVLKPGGQVVFAHWD